jgi:putative transport protein
MLDVLAQNAVLTLFLVVATGSLIGLIPFGPIRFGPAGALFVGLLLGAIDERLGQDLGLIRTVGLALFVYTVGLASGPTLIRTFRRQAALMLASALVLALIGAATVAAGRIVGIGGGSLVACSPVSARAPRRWPPPPAPPEVARTPPSATR